jgi:hypothetical protein
MRTLIAHAVGFSVGILVVIIFSTVVYGSVEARPIWTTVIGIGVWFLLSNGIKNIGKEKSADRSNKAQEKS